MKAKDYMNEATLHQISALLYEALSELSDLRASMREIPGCLSTAKPDMPSEPPESPQSDAGPPEGPEAEEAPFNTTEDDSHPLLAFMDAQGLNALDVAGRLGVSPGQIAKWMRGEGLTKRGAVLRRLDGLKPGLCDALYQWGKRNGS